MMPSQQDAVEEVQLQSLGPDLNTALARVAPKNARRAEFRKRRAWSA